MIRPGAHERQTIDKLVPTGEGPEAWDRAALVEVARALKDQHPEVRTAVVSAENSIRYEVLIETYAALLGEGCDQPTGEGCMFPMLIIEAGAG